MAGWFRKLRPSEPLDVAMIGVKLGDRVLAVGTGDAALLAALSIKVGITGNTTVVHTAPTDIEGARQSLEREGAIVDLVDGASGRMPVADESIDVAVIPGGVAGLAVELRRDQLREIFRTLRRGGRAVIIEPRVRGGATDDRGQAAIGALQYAGFPAARVLAERDGVVYAEAIKRA